MNPSNYWWVVPAATIVAAFAGGGFVSRLTSRREEWPGCDRTPYDQGLNAVDDDLRALGYPIDAAPGLPAERVRLREDGASSREAPGVVVRDLDSHRHV